MSCMLHEIYFFDTYAVIAILKGNPAYAPYVKKTAIITQLNAFEIFYNVLRDFDEQTARRVVDKYYPSLVGFSRDIVEEASAFRYANKKKKLSITDCIGYIIAQRLKIKFLTGDKEFEHLTGVEFVK